MNLSKEQLQSLLNQASIQVEIGSIYAHYRNQALYKVIGIGLLEATQEVGIIYQEHAVSNPLTWIRPISSFLEEVFADDLQVARFQKIPI